MLPSEETEGVGIYSLNSADLLKELKAAGVDAAFLHEPDQRRWRVLHGEVPVEFIMGVASSLVASGIWDIVKVRFRGLFDRNQELRCRIVTQHKTAGGEIHNSWLEYEGPLEGFLEVLPTVAMMMPWTSDDLSWPEQRGLELQTEASRAMARSYSCPRDESEDLARRALSLRTSAFNWLEDTKYEEKAHKKLHQFGRPTRKRFPKGCAFVWNGSGYEQRCPVAIAHKRFGFSPSMILGKRICSVCAEDASECPHLRTEKYAVRGGRNATGYCPVCMSKDDCDHSPSTTYWVRPTGIVTTIERVDEISIVAKPVDPDARLLALPVNKDDVIRSLGSTFAYGHDTVACSRCLLPCSGFQQFREDGTFSWRHR